MFATWEEAEDVVKQADVKARITGVAAKMKEFNFLFCLMLAEKFLKHCDNLSRTIQSSSMPAVEARRLSELCIRIFQKMRDNEDFDLFWALTQQTQKQLDVNDPILQRQRKRPRRYEDGSASPFFFSDPKEYYRSMYFQCLDAVIAAITDRFHQHDYSIYANLEQVLIKACTQEDYSKELEEVTQFFHADFDKSLLKHNLSYLDIWILRSQDSP